MRLYLLGWLQIVWDCEDASLRAEIKSEIRNQSDLPSPDGQICAANVEKLHVWPVSEEVIPIPSGTSASKWFAAVRSPAIREAIQECLQSTALGYAGPLLPYLL